MALVGRWALLDGAVLLVDGSGHYPQADSPDVVGSAIVKFVEDAAA